MPQLVDTDRNKKPRGRTRSYDMTPYLEQSLETGKGLLFTVEELQEDFGVRAQSAGSAARTDAEAMTEARSDGKVVKVFVRTNPRPDTKDPKTGKPLEDLEIQAYYDNTNAVNPDADEEADEGSSSAKGKGK